MESKIALIHVLTATDETSQDWADLKLFLHLLGRRKKNSSLLDLSASPQVKIAVQQSYTKEDCFTTFCTERKSGLLRNQWPRHRAPISNRIEESVVRTGRAIPRYPTSNEHYLANLPADRPVRRCGGASFIQSFG